MITEAWVESKELVPIDRRKVQEGVVVVSMLIRTNDRERTE